MATTTSRCSRSSGSPCSTASAMPHINVSTSSVARMQRALSQPLNRPQSLSLNRRSPRVAMRSFAAYGDSLLNPGYDGLDLASQIASSAVLTAVAAALAYFLSMREAAYQVSATAPLATEYLEYDSTNLLSALPLIHSILSSKDRSNNQSPCPRCEGRRVEPCVCNRWSDGGQDIGCSSCKKSGMMPCRSCRGGGTAVPIKARIYVPSRGGSGQSTMSTSLVPTTTAGNTIAAAATLQS